MYHYRLFGATLAAEIALPGLEAAPAGEPRWTLHLPAGERPGPDGAFAGEDSVYGEVRVRLYRRETGLRLVFDDTGCFDLSGDGCRIDWYRPPGASLDHATADLTGRVLAAALHAAGTLCLHGSAVVLDGSAVGIVAPKGHGKSTLALALVGAGGRLLTDDTLPVRAGDPPLALPGLHATRLWADSAARVGIGRAEAPAPGEKLLFSALPPERVTHRGAPLAALYLLSPVRAGEGGPAARRVLLPATEAALAMIGHAKLAPLLGKAETLALFRAATGLARRLPVYRLEVVRDLDRLAEAVEAIRAWHAPVPGVTGPTPPGAPPAPPR